MKRPYWELLWHMSPDNPLPPWATARGGPGLCYAGSEDGEPARPFPGLPCKKCYLPRAESKSYPALLTLYHQLKIDKSVWKWLAEWRLCTWCGRWHHVSHAKRNEMQARAG
jgi:hypothetical protein